MRPHADVSHTRKLPALEELQARPQWVCWRKEERRGKLTKVPYSATTGKHAKADTPQTWATYVQAVQAQRAAIDAQVAALQQKYDAAARAAGGGSGVFAWPEPACGFGCISQPFGCSTFYLEPYDSSCPYPHRIHTGVDIAAPYRSPIVAADTGVIYFYPWSVGYGNYIIIFHGNGYSTHYGHLAGYAAGLQSGQIVARGDLIGYEGSTGWSTGPHLHFEVRVNNTWKNPCIWLGC